ncbi:hypothetical protein C8Q75DRAFT_747853, partial [Abortiporus biennis]
MLIFSVSFQFFRMSPRRGHDSLFTLPSYHQTLDFRSSCGFERLYEACDIVWIWKDLTGLGRVGTCGVFLPYEYEEVLIRAGFSCIQFRYNSNVEGLFCYKGSGFAAGKK